MYADLKWDRLQQVHGSRWDMLKTKYGIHFEQISDPPSLEDLAQRCVDLCRDILFDEKESSNLITYTRSTQLANQDVSTATCRISDLEGRLKIALADHLIVTFAHRFYCDNLVPRNLDTCLRIMAQHYIEKTEDLIRDKERRADFRDSKRQTFIKFQDNIKDVADCYKSLFADNIPECQERVASETAFIINDILSAPNWLFSLCMANNWKNSPYMVGKRKNGTENGMFNFLKGWDDEKEIFSTNLLEKLTQFVAQNKFSRFLFRWEDNPRQVSNPHFVPVANDIRTVLELRAATNALSPTFSAIACSVPPPICVRAGVCDFRLTEERKCDYNVRCTSQGKCKYEEKDNKGNTKTYRIEARCAVEPQRYAVRGGHGGKKEISISQDLQYIFNNYLFEKYFHGYAIANMLYYMEPYFQNNISVGQGIQLDSMIRIVRLHAPTLHVPMMRFLSDNVPQLSFIEWAKSVDQFIDYWNSVALPILEEAFLWGITTYYSLDTVFDAVETCFLQNAQRCDRLNYIRLFFAEQKSPHHKAYVISGSGEKIKKTEYDYDPRPSRYVSDYSRSMIDSFNKSTLLGYTFGMDHISGQGFRCTWCTIFDTGIPTSVEEGDAGSP